LLCAALTSLGQYKYQSLLWEISGNGLRKPSYLYGTMHISGKLAFQLGDPFYDCIQSSDVVALELEPEEWLQALFNDPQILQWLGSASFDEGYYDEFESDSPLPPLKGFWNPGNDLMPHERVREVLQYKPDILNYLMFRYGNGEFSGDFEEDTWLDMHIYQTAKKMGRGTMGFETYAQSDEFIRKANMAEAEQVDRKEWDDGDIRDYQELNRQLEPAYRRQDLDFIDSLTRHATSAAFRNFILLERNKVFVQNMDSVMLRGQSVFAAMGCAHLPGEGGVIESLRALGYRVVPLNKGSRNAKRRKEIDNRVYSQPSLPFTSSDGLITLNTPSSMYCVGAQIDAATWLCLDIPNGANYTLTRLKTYNGITGYSTNDVLTMIDSMLYESLAGEIIARKAIKVGGFNGIDVINKTRRGDFERQRVIVIPDEIIVLKLEASGDKVKQGLGAAFFDSIKITDSDNSSRQWKSLDGAVSVQLPGRAICYDEISTYSASSDFEVVSTDASSGSYYTVQRHVIETPEFLDEDAYELSRFMRAFCEDRNLSVSSFELTEIQGKSVLRAELSGWKDNIYTLKDVVYALFVINANSYIALSTNEKDSERRESWFGDFKLEAEREKECHEYRNDELCFSVCLPFVPLNLSPSSDGMMFNADLEQNVNTPFGTNASTVLSPPHHADALSVFFQRYHEYSDGEDKNSFLREKRELVLGLDMRVISEHSEWTERGVNFEFVVGDTATSRRFHHRMVLHNKSFYHLSTCYDSIIGMPHWVSTALESFQSIDTVFPFPHFELRDNAYFDALTSQDSAARARALTITSEMDFSAESAGRMRGLLKSLPNFTAEDAEHIKTKILSGLSADTSATNINFLANEFNAYPDSSKYQYEILLTLLRMKTANAWKSYSRLVVEEPPIVFDEMGGSGCETLFDSVLMAAPLLPQLMQLLAIDEYEESIYHLMAMAADEGRLPLSSYRHLLPQILVEARNELKRLNSSIETGYGFSTDVLMDYCSLLNPARKEKDVNLFFAKAYNTKKGELLLDLLRFDLNHDVVISDSLIARVARMKDQVHPLYASLFEAGKASRMPAHLSTRNALAQCYLIHQYESTEQKADSIVFLENTPKEIRGRNLDVHFYKVLVNGTGQWLGHILAFDASEPSNAWPLFIESDRTIVLDPDEDITAELEREFLYMEELNREYLNFGSGNTDFSLHWY
jgi:uncharacterized protein YbaP (TraB family)